MSTANVFLKKTWDSCIIPHHEPHVPQGSEGGKTFRMLPTIAINFLAYGNPLQITWNNLKGDSSSMTNHFMNESFVSFVSFISKSSGFPQKNPSISCASCSTSDHRSAGISALMPSRPSSSVAICHPILLTWMMWFKLVGGFNPVEKYQSKWESSQTGMKIKHIWNHHLARDWKWFEGNFRSFEVILFSDFVQGKIMSFDEFSTTKKSDMSIRRCQFLHHFGPGAPGAEEPKKLRVFFCEDLQSCGVAMWYNMYII